MIDNNNNNNNYNNNNWKFGWMGSVYCFGNEVGSGAGTFFRQGGLKIVRSCQRLGGEAPQTPLFSNARF